MYIEKKVLSYNSYKKKKQNITVILPSRYSRP